ncbi:MAG: LON peptidase substrate-binding domain-containing protein [Planctomycetota bacterium]
MQDEPEAVHVNFGRAIPIFPLPGVSLLPQQVLPLHIFEPRYRQMIDQALDGPGLIAMAVLAPGDGEGPWGDAAVRPAVCVGRISEHEKLPDGRYNLMLQGICRAEIVEELEPADGRLFRLARLDPLEEGASVVGDSDEESPWELDAERERLDEMLSSGPLAQLTVAEAVLGYVRNEQVPTALLLDIVGIALVTDEEPRYHLLAEGDAVRRRAFVRGEVERLAQLLLVADKQPYRDWPKGMSWN